MNRKKSQAVGMVWAGVLILLLGTNLSFGRVQGNKGDIAYTELPETTSASRVASIEDFIVTGAGFYFKANVDAQTLLTIIELQDVDGVVLDDLQKVVDSSLKNINAAVDSYSQLLDKAKSTPYNQIVINQLSQFDYTDFRLKYGLSPDTFGKVEVYLRDGNITGIFKEIYENCLQIQKMLMAIKSDIEQNRMPELSVCWQLNEKFAESSLFGSYAARVFYAIDK